MDTITTSVQELADREQRCYWIGTPPSGRPRVADNPETLQQTGCSALRVISPNRPPGIDAALRS